LKGSACRYIYFFFFFLNKGSVPKDLDTAINLSGGITEYREDHKVNKNYNQALTECKQDPKVKKKKAIRALSTAKPPPRTAIRAVAGDYATWDGAAGNRRAGAEEGPPLWRAGQEVDKEMTPAGRRQSSEQPPFGYVSRRQDGLRPSEDRRGCAPGCSTTRTLTSIRSAPARETSPTSPVTSMTRGKESTKARTSGSTATIIEGRERGIEVWK
jgi:hypothetical protein